jgi:hypothetical protein
MTETTYLEQKSQSVFSYCKDFWFYKHTSVIVIMFYSCKERITEVEILHTLNLLDITSKLTFHGPKV